MFFISTPQKIRNILESQNNGSDDESFYEIKDFFKKNLFLLVIDEAHRAGSPTYKKIIENLSEQNDFLSVAGLTATPFRTEYLDNPDSGTESLKEIFKNLILPEKTLGSDLSKIKKELYNREYLARLKKVKVDTHMNIKLKETDKNFISAEDVEVTSQLDMKLQSRVDRTKRRMIILDAIKEQVRKSPSGKFLYFGPTVKDVRLMTLLLRKCGYSADYVIGGRRLATRRKIIDDFKKGKLQFLCNCEVLTTGFDEPKITHLIMARPTVSQVLYEQMIGRGLRGIKFGGTDSCKILSCEDMDMNYDEFYKIWRNDSDYKSYSFEEVFIKTLIFALRADGQHKDIEKRYLKNSLKVYLQREVSDEYINQKIEENFKYFDELPEMMSSLSRAEQLILKDESVEMCKVDGELHSKEREFLEILSRHLYLRAG